MSLRNGRKRPETGPDVALQLIHVEVMDFNMDQLTCYSLLCFTT